MLSAEELSDYQRFGYALRKGAVAEKDILRLERGVANNPPLDGTLDPNAPVFPNPGRYTLATQSAADPDLGFIIEYPNILAPVKQLLGDDPKLTAYVIYDRTPGGAGLPAHHDYKRWRPVGSSMNWLFTIVPFCNFNESTGRLLIAPGSHRLDRISRTAGRCAEVDAAIKPTDAEFVDLGLERGDLLIMNMHLWHKAEANQSEQHRMGLFNKYAAADSPPATGYYLFNDAVASSLSDQGQSLIAVHSNKDIVSTRVLLMRQRDNQWEVYLQRSADSQNSNRLSLPGGPTWRETAIADWDLGNYIAPAQEYLRKQVNIDTPWLSYVGDYDDVLDEQAGLCRLYAYTLNDNGFPVNYAGEWIAQDQLVANTNIAHNWAQPSSRNMARSRH